MSYYHHLFEAYVNKTTRSVNCLNRTEAQVWVQVHAADRLQQKILSGNTLVEVTVKNVNTEYWKDARKEANPS